MRIYTLILSSIVAASICAAPARQGWQLKAKSQEVRGDSQEIVSVRLMGDEYYHYWETRDGKLAIEQADGTFVVTDEPVPTPSEVQARRKASPLYAYRSPQDIGTINLAPRGLVILAGYKNLAFSEENTQEAMWEMMNKEGYNYNGATGSAADYFKAQSNGQYAPVFDVVGPVTLPKNRADYGGNTGGPNTDKDAKQMIVDACKAVDDQVDFTLYDNNGDGRIDFVYVIYAGIGENDDSSISEAVWAHNSSAYSKNCTLDKKRLDNYACSAEIDGVTKERNGIGVICHEFGHVIGLPDYYDTNGSSGGSTSGMTPNEWSVMDYGCYNNDVKTPPNYSIFDKYYMGWLTPAVLPKDAQTDITLGSAYSDGYQITKDGTAVPYSCTDTVYYIENRRQSGWDAPLDGHGMLVWRVVYNAADWSGNKMNSNTNAIRYTLVSAGGGNIIGWKDNGKEVLHTGKDDPFPGGKNTTSYMPWEGYAMTEIAEVDGNVTFKLNGGSPATKSEGVQNTEYRVQKVLRNGQIFILRGDQTYTITGQQHN